MGVNLQVLALLGELQHSERSKIINLQCLLDWVVEVNRRCAIDNYVTIIDKHFSLGIRQAQVLNNQIAHYRHYLTLRPGIKVWFSTMLLLHNRKHITIQNFIFDSFKWFSVSFCANHYVELVYTWASSHQFFENNLTQEAGAPREQNVFALVEFPYIQWWLRRSMTLNLVQNCIWSFFFSRHTLNTIFFKSS